MNTTAIRRLHCLLGATLSIACSTGLASERIIVKFREAPGLMVQTAENSQLRAAGIMQDNTRASHWVRASDENTHIFRFEPTVTPSDVQAQINRLRSDPRVQFAVVDRKVETHATANDTFFTRQWSLGNQTAGAARFSDAWDTYRGSASTVVAVVDTGVLPDHPDLKGRVLRGYDFISVAAIGNDGDARDRNSADPGSWVDAADRSRTEFKDCGETASSWHGTYVAGLIAGNTNDGSGSAGANWNARLLPIRALGKCGGYLSDVMDGARWAAGIPIPGIPNNPYPAAIINLSLGSAGACGTYEQEAINQINARNAVVVVAAGNRAGTLDSPASCGGVIAVGAVDEDGIRASYSAIGANTTLMAPGGDTTAMIGPGNTGKKGPESNAWFFKVGTSFAAPMVSAALAMMHGINGRISFNQASDALRRTARPFPAAGNNPVCTANFGRGKCACTTSLCGAGLLDAANLMASLRTTAPIANISLSDVRGGGWLLDSSATRASTGRAIVSHTWEQVSGPQQVTMTDTGIIGQRRTSAATASGEYVFRVTVQDSAGQSHQSTVARVIGNGETGSESPVAAAPGNQQIPTGGNTGSSVPDNDSGTPGTDAPAAGGGSPGGANGGGGGGSLPAHSVAILMLGLTLLRHASRNVVKASTGSR